MSSSIKRLAAASIIATALTLTACAGAGTPTPTSTASATPTPTAAPTAITGDAPADESEAIEKAEATIDLLLSTQAEIGAAGGANPERYDTIATGNALREFQQDAMMIAEGPLVNQDGESIPGQATVEGSLIFEPTTAYGQEWEGVANGLVTVPGCLDLSERKITTADGKPAMQNPSPRNQVEFQVIYNAETKTWLVSDRISLGTPC